MTLEITEKEGYLIRDSLEFYIKRLNQRKFDATNRNQTNLIIDIEVSLNNMEQLLEKVKTKLGV